MTINNLINISNLEVFKIFIESGLVNTLLSITFQPIHNFAFSLIIALLLFSIFIRAYILNNKENDTRLHIVAAAFLTAGILEVFHVIESYYNDFITSSSVTLLKAFIHLGASNLIIAISLFLTGFYALQLSKSEASKVKWKINLLYFLILILIIILTNYAGISLSVGLSNKLQNLVFYNPATVVLDNSLFVLAVFSFMSARRRARIKPLTLFTTGLLILGIGELYIVTPGYLISLYRFYIHIAKITALIFIFAGLKDIVFPVSIESFREKIAVYPALYLLFFYLIYTSFRIIVYDPPTIYKGEYLFLTLFIIAIIIGYYLSGKLAYPVENLTKGVEKLKANVKPQMITSISNDEFLILSNKINEFANTIWEYTNNLIDKQNELEASIYKEKALKNIILTGTSKQELDDMLQSICEEVLKIFNVERASITIYNSNQNKFTVLKEYKVNSKIDYIGGKSFTSEYINYWGEKLIQEQKPIIIPNIMEYNAPENIKNICKSIGLKSILASLIKQDSEIWGEMALITYSQERNWTNYEIELVETVSAQVFTLLRQAELYSNIRKQIQREELVRELIEITRSSLDLNEVLNSASIAVTKLFNVQRTTISQHLFGIKAGEWAIKSEYKSSKELKGIIDIVGIEKFTTEGLSLMDKIARYINEVVFSGNNLFVINDISNSDAPDFFKNTYVQMGVKSIIGVPIQRGDDLYGVIVLSDYEKIREWNEDEIRLLTTVAGQIYLAIKQAELYTITKKQAERAQLVKVLIDTIGTNLELTTVLDTVSKEILNLFNVDRALVAIFPYGQEYIDSVIGENKSGEDILGINDIDYPSDTRKFFWNKLLNEGTDIIFNNVEQSDTPQIFKDTYKKLNVQSMLAVPIKKGMDKWGIIVLTQVKSQRNWTDDELDLLHTIADYVYIAARQAELYSITKKQAERERLLRNIITTIRKSLNIKETKYNIVYEIGKTFDADRCNIIEYDSSSKTFLPIDLYSEYLSSSNIKSLFGFSLETEGFEFFTKLFKEEKKEFFAPELIELIAAQDPNNQDLRSFLNNLEIKSTYALPILYAGELQGILNVHYAKNYRRLDNDDMEFLKILASQTGLALHQAKLYQTVKFSALRERQLREIISEIKLSHTPDDIYNIIVTKLAQIFNLNRVLFLDISAAKKDKAMINKEYLGNNTLILLENTAFPKKFIELMFNFSDKKEFAVINSKDNDIKKSKELSNFLEKYNFCSVLSIPIIKPDKVTPINGAILLCAETTRKWTPDDINFLKRVSDSIISVIWELNRRVEIENLRNAFVLTLAHDLQVPIVGEHKALEFLNSRKDESPIGNYKEIINDIIASNENLSSLLTKLVDSYNYESGKQKLYKNKVSVLEITNSTIEKFKYKINEKAFNIINKVSLNLPYAYADREEVTKVFNNLLENAINYTQPGGTIVINAYKQDNENLTICLGDNGPGISTEIRERIFQRYAMAVAIERKVGSGLGLYLSKQIIEAHGGRIWYVTELGKGTKFFFTLPVCNK